MADLSATHFADITVLNTLLYAQHLHHDAHRALFVAGLFPAPVRRLFDLTDAASVLNLEGDLTLARQAPVPA